MLCLITCIFVATVLLPIDNAICIKDDNGRVYIVDTSQISEGKYSIELLPGGHFPRDKDKVDFLIGLRGKLNAAGFLSAIGATSIVEQERLSNMYYVNSVPCTVLMSIGKGFQGSFTQCSNESTCLICWAFPCNDN